MESQMEGKQSREREGEGCTRGVVRALPFHRFSCNENKIDREGGGDLHECCFFRRFYYNERLERERERERERECDRVLMI